MPPHDGSAATATRPAHLVAAGVLTLALVGDAMLYAVLPATAETYALGAAGVAAVLSINRFVRLLLNPLVARVVARTGLRAGSLIGAALAVLSTAAYAVAPGLAWLLAARVVWGSAFATLRLSMLAYATLEPRQAARRLGNATALQELAPAVLLVAGTAALAWLGVRGLFAALAVLTLFALPLALALPRAQAPRVARSPTPVHEHGDAADTPARRRSRPWGASSVSASVAFGVDGALMAGVVLALIVIGWSPLQAAQTGGALLAARKLIQVATATLAGRIGERFGASSVVRWGALATTVGLAAMALAPWSSAALLGGAVIAMSAAALVLTLVPAVVAGGETGARLKQLGWLATGRDLGAAMGAAAAPLVLAGGATPAAVTWMFAAAAALVLVSLALWRTPAVERAASS